VTSTEHAEQIGSQSDTHNCDSDDGVPVDWTALLNEFPRRSIDGVYNAVMGSAIIPGLSLPNDQTLTPDETDEARKPDSITEALADPNTWIAAFKRPEGATLLAYFLYVWGMWLWERTSEYDEIAEKVAKAAQGYRRAKETIKGASGFDQSQELVDILIDELITPKPEVASPADLIPPTTGALLLDCMDVEVALNNSSAKAMKRRTHDVVRRARRLLEVEAINSAGAADGIRGLLRHVLHVHSIYYAALEEVADTFLSVGPNCAVPLPQLGETITKLESCQKKDLKGDVFASELRTHRYALQALAQRFEDKHLPALRFESVKFVYIYPFAIPGPTGHAISEEVGKYRENPADTRSPLKLATARASGVEDVELRPGTSREIPFTDLWTWGGPDEESMAGSIGLPMPSLSVQIPDEDDDPVGGYEVEVRFNNLGNHYLRIEKELRDPTLIQVTQSLRRASWAIGREIVTCAGGGRWESLVEYASKIVEALPDWLSQFDGVRQLTPEEIDELGHLVDMDRDHHTLVEIRAASIQHRDGDHDATGDEVLLAAGPLLVQPVNPVATTLHEWMCWERVGSTAKNLLDYRSFMSDFAVGTGSETVLCMLSSPDWMHTGYSEVVEFVASLPALMRLSKLELVQKTAYADNALEYEHHRDAGTAEKGADERELGELRLDLHDMVEKIRRRRMYLNPSELLGSVNWGCEKGFLGNLYALPTITDLRADIDGRLARADTTIDRIAAREVRLHEERVQWTLFFVSLFSFTGFLGLGLQLLFGAGIRGMVDEDGAWPDWVFLVVTAVYLILVYVAWALFKNWALFKVHRWRFWRHL
jgi:hypothetical protein